MNEHTHNPRDRRFGELVRQHQGLLFTIVYGITLDREDTLDLLQETFLRASREPRLFEPEFAARAWLVRVARNLALNFKRSFMRSFRRLLHIGSLASAEPGVDPLAALVREDDLQSLRALLQHLAPAERELLMLRYGAELSVTEIATELGVPQGTVMSRLARLRERLGDALDDKEETA